MLVQEGNDHILHQNQPLDQHDEYDLTMGK